MKVARLATAFSPPISVRDEYFPSSIVCPNSDMNWYKTPITRQWFILKTVEPGTMLHSGLVLETSLERIVSLDLHRQSVRIYRALERCLAVERVALKDNE